jgi:predicted GTPase
MNAGPATISVALLSHTNAGKTTLARTLLRRDIGAVMDRAHVTEEAEEYELMRSAEGDRLLLWDTPGRERTADRLVPVAGLGPLRRS